MEPILVIGSANPDHILFRKFCCIVILFYSYFVTETTHIVQGSRISSFFRCAWVACLSVAAIATHVAFSSSPFSWGWTLPKRLCEGLLVDLLIMRDSANACRAILSPSARRFTFINLFIMLTTRVSGFWESSRDFRRLSLI